MMIDLLTLKQTHDDEFVSDCHQESFRESLFGGQVLAQALMAAGQSGLAAPPHSIHAYFLRAGTTAESISYRVERTRDGRAFHHRVVRAYQGERLLAIVNASFHSPEPGFEHQLTGASDTTTPESLLRQQPATDCAHLARRAEGLENVPIEFVPCSGDLFKEAASDRDSARFWFRCRQTLPPKTPLFHYAALLFASDIGLLASALLRHETSLFSGKVFPASLDHSLWFHRQPDFNQWHEYVTESPWAGGGRALCRGYIVNEARDLVASTTQEGLIRPIAPPSASTPR